jgi:hypothetical protein
MQPHTAASSEPTLRTQHAAIPAGARATGVMMAGMLVAAMLAIETPLFAQQQIQPQRIGGTANQGSRIQGGVNRVPSGSGNALGDGSGMGGQTFNWSRGAGAGRSMGSGNALDANSQVGSGGSNNAQTPVDYNARNLIVTNSVPGGRGFRGSVGYTADTDFRARTGSDASYRFRADSAMSNPAFVGSIASRDRFQIAQGLGVFEFRRDTTPVGQAERQAAAMGNDSRLRLDRVNADMSFGRMNWELGEDRTIARGQGQDGQAVRYIVSPLRGLQSESLADPVVKSGLGLYEQARARADMNAGLTTAEDYLRGADPNLGTSMRVEGQRFGESLGAESRVQNAKMVPKTYFDLVEELEKRAEEKTGVKGGGLENVREQIDGIGKPKTSTQGAPGLPGDTIGDRETNALPGQQPTDPNTPSKPSAELTVPDGGEALREEKRIEERGKLLPVPEMAEILRHGRTFDQLGTSERRRVDDLVRQGEDALRKGEYFQAERRFTQAQSVASGNPLVEVGIAHAQIGAGLYLSAGLTLRNLFTANPELIDARYDAKLLPTGDRLTAGVRLMRERILRGDDAPGYGLVLAYIGHQQGDRGLVNEGLAAITGSAELDGQRALLEGVWAPKDAPKEAPQQAPKQAPKQ